MAYTLTHTQQTAHAPSDVQHAIVNFEYYLLAWRRAHALESVAAVA